jgi:hypothetical protein
MALRQLSLILENGLELLVPIAFQVNRKQRKACALSAKLATLAFAISDGNVHDLS